MSTKQSTLFKNIPKETIGYYLPPRPIIVEAGAHIGRDTIKMKKKWPDCTIHAFEPAPELFVTLKQKTASLSNIHCYPYALSNNTEKRLFYLSSGRSTATSSLFKPTGYKQEHPDTIFTPITVQTITLDSWAVQYAIKHVDALWFDMQGEELAALQGAQTLLKTVSIIHTEATLTERYKDAPLYPEIKTWLFQQGFRVAYEAFGQSDWGNVLFVR